MWLHCGMTTEQLPPLQRNSVFESKRFVMTLVLIVGLLHGAIDAQDVLVVGNSGDKNIYLINLENGQICRTITAHSRIRGIAADDSAQVLYYNDDDCLFRVPYRGGESTFIGEFNGDSSTIFGLGYDEANSKLYGCFSSGIYEIDISDANATLVFDPPGQNALSGIDFDRVTGEMYVADDSGAGVAGPGIYRVDLTNSSYVGVANPYYGGLSDVDGLGVRNGLVYSVLDGEQPTDTIQEARLSDGVVIRNFTLPFITGGIGSAGTVASIGPVDIPSNGRLVPELEILDETILEFMKLNDIGACMLAVMNDGTTVYHRCFGWQDAGRNVELPLNTIMRLASVTKPLTAAATRKLVTEGSISLQDFVFDDGSNDGILDLQPFGVPDPRIYDITVDHLLRHRGGWDRGIAGDLTYMETTIAAAMGLPSPPGRLATVRWIMGQPLQVDPGSEYIYSNIGFLLLGMIVEQESGQPLIEFLREGVFGPIGILDCQLIHGRTFATEHDPREPWYNHHGRISPNVFYPIYDDDEFVFSPYGGWDHEARIGQGAVVADPLAILEFLNHFQVNGDDIGGPRPLPGNWRWNHTGSFIGTNTLARQRGDGINYVVLFNKRPQSGVSSYSSQIRTILDAIFDNGQIGNWPTYDVTRDLIGDLNCDGNVDLLDVSPFVSFLSSSGYSPRGDINDDGMMNLLDVAPFVDLLVGQ